METQGQNFEIGQSCMRMHVFAHKLWIPILEIPFQNTELVDCRYLYIDIRFLHPRVYAVLKQRTIPVIREPDVERFDRKIAKYYRKGVVADESDYQQYLELKRLEDVQSALDKAINDLENVLARTAEFCLD